MRRKTGSQPNLTPLLDLLIIIIFVQSMQSELQDFTESEKAMAALEAEKRDVESLERSLAEQSARAAALEQKVSALEDQVETCSEGRAQLAQARDQALRARSKDLEEMSKLLGMKLESVENLVRDLDEKAQKEILDSQAVSGAELVKKLRQMAEVRRHVAFWSIEVNAEGRATLDLGDGRRRLFSFLAGMDHDAGKFRNAANRIFEESLGEPPKQSVFVTFAHEPEVRFGPWHEARRGAKQWMNELRRRFAAQGKFFKLIEMGPLPSGTPESEEE